MINRPHFSFSLIFLAFLALLTFWLDYILKPEDQTEGADRFLNPDYIVEDLMGIRMDHELAVLRKFSANELFHFIDDELTRMDKISFINVDPKSPLLRLQADHAEVRSRGQTIYLTGNVSAIRGEDDEKGKITLKTDYLHLAPDKHLIETDQPINISRFNTTVNAIGMEFDSQAGMIQLLSKVKAVDTK